MLSKCYLIFLLSVSYVDYKLIRLIPKEKKNIYIIIEAIVNLNFYENNILRIGLKS